MNFRWRLDRFSSSVSLMALAFGIGCLLTASTSSADADADADAGYSDRSRDAAEETQADGWEYDPYYIFPLTRHMSDSGLPKGGQYALYPLAVVIDLGQWPFGALAGLAGK